MTMQYITGDVRVTVISDLEKLLDDADIQMRKANKDAAKNNLDVKYFAADRALQKKLLDECLNIRARYLFLDRTYGDIIRKYPHDVRPLICRLKAVTQSNILFMQHSIYSAYSAYFSGFWGAPENESPSQGASFINLRYLRNLFRRLANLFISEVINRASKKKVEQGISFIETTKEEPPVGITNLEDIEKIKEACDECLEKLHFVLNTGKFEGVFDEGVEEIRAVVEREELNCKIAREHENNIRRIAEGNPFPGGRLISFCILAGGIILGWSIWRFWGALLAVIVFLVTYGIVKDKRIESLLKALDESQNDGEDVTDE